MSSEVSQLSRKFLASTSDDLLRSWVIDLIDAYDKSHARAKEEFHRGISKWYRPFLRRAIIEQKLFDSPDKFGGLISSGVEEDDASNFWTHTVVICSGTIALTQSTARDADYVIRRSTFRKQQAQSNEEQKLLAFLAEPKPKVAPATGTHLYAILLHGRDPSSVGRLGFATVRFPRPDLSGYYSEKIPLLSMFPDLAKRAAAASEDTETAEEETIGDLPEIDLNEEEAAE